MAKFLILSGIGLVFTGIFWHFGLLKWIGKLPGDIRIEKESVVFYFPLTTCLVLSLTVMLLLRATHFFMNSRS